MVGVGRELGLEPVVLPSCEPDFRTLRTDLAGGRLALRHLDVLLDVQRDRGRRKGETCRAHSDHHHHRDTGMPERSGEFP